MRYIVAICLCVYSFTTNAQDITGTWEEHSETRETNYTKISIVKICGQYIAYAYDSDISNGFCKTNMIISYNKRSRELYAECISFEDHTSKHVLGIYYLRYKTRKNEERLEGLLYEKPPLDSLKLSRYSYLDSMIGTIGTSEFVELFKTSDKVDSSVYMKLMAAKPCKTNPSPPVAVVIPPEEKIIEKPVEQKIVEKPVVDTPVVSPEDIILQMQRNRKNDTLSVVPTTEKELTIRVVDNALNDGDTISILHNRKLIAQQLPVSRQPFTIKITLSKENPEHELILVAHNLGSIPPNTALLLISSGDKEYRLYAFADLKKNAVIVFRYIGE